MLCSPITLEVDKLLQDYQDSYTPTENQAEVAAEVLSKENLESMCEHGARMVPTQEKAQTSHTSNP